MTHVALSMHILSGMQLNVVKKELFGDKDFLKIGKNKNFFKISHIRIPDCT